MVNDKVTLCLQKFVAEAKEALGDAVVAIIHTGGSVEKEWIEGWSDLDICIVVESVDWEVQREIHRINKKLAGEYKFHLGTSVISRKEYDSTVLMDNCFKTLLMKQGLLTGRSELIFGRAPSGPVDLKKKKDSFAREVSFFKAHLRNGARDLEGPQLLQRCIKCAHYAVLGALLYEGVVPSNRAETIKEAKKVFGDFAFGFTPLERAAVLRSIFDQSDVNYEEESKRIVTFVEQFVAYFYERAINV